MALTSPDKLIIGKIKPDTTSIIETFSSGSSVFDLSPLTYNAQFDIIPQSAASGYETNNLYTYTAYDIEVGWKFNTPSGRIYDVVAIDVYSNESASIDIRDTNLREYINSPSDPPDNAPDTNYGIFIPVNNGVPSLSNLTQNSGLFPDQSYWTDDIIAHSITYLAESGSGGGTGSVTINNNVDNYLIIATGTANTLNGESSLRYDGTGLIIGATGSAQALLQISGSGDLLLIKNGSNNGIKVNSQGVLQFLSQSSTPTAIAGGIYYSGSAFYVGID
jgi:hypothetical protein